MAPLILNLALHGGKWTISHPSHFTPREECLERSELVDEHVSKPAGSYEEGKMKNPSSLQSLMKFNNAGMISK